MLSLSQACSTKAKLEVPFGEGNNLTLWHNPSVFTAEFEMQAREDLKSETASVFLLNTLSKLVVEWDLVDDEGVVLGEEHKGEVIPITVDNLKRIPFSILIKVSNAISATHGTQEDGDTKKDVGDTQIPSGSFS